MEKIFRCKIPHHEPQVNGGFKVFNGGRKYKFDVPLKPDPKDEEWKRQDVYLRAYFEPAVVETAEKKGETGKDKKGGNKK